MSDIQPDRRGRFLHYRSDLTVWPKLFRR